MSMTLSRKFDLFEEKICDLVIDEARLLLKENYEEAGVSFLNFDPDYEAYKNLYSQDMIRAFSMREKESGKLVGYQVFMLIKHLHYKDTLWAMQDFFYIKPEFRGWPAMEFVRWADRILFGSGVDIIYRHVSLKKDYSGLLEFLEYAPVEKSYAKRRRLYGA